MTARRAFGVGTAWLAAVTAAMAQTAQPPVVPIDAAPLPASRQRVPASTEECAVWQRELAFARSVERHDGSVFASFLHPGAVFDAGSAAAERGSEAVRRSWQPIVDGVQLGLRWRPGIVQIGGDPNLAVSRGPYILQSERTGVMAWRVGFYQSIWQRERPGAPWRVLFDGSASTPLPVADRMAAEAWVVEQTVSDCSGR